MPSYAARGTYRGGMTAWEDDEDEGWTPPTHLPLDAQRMGLNRSVPDGALLDFAGSLDPAKPLHRVTAWVMLVVFAFPAALYVVRILWGLLLGF